MFCVNCGKELGEEDSFCTNCGCPVEREETGEHSGKKGFGKKGFGKTVFILIPVLAVAVCVIAAFGMNFFRRTFSSPEKYFQYVTKKYVREEAEVFANQYDRLVKESYNVSDKSVSAKLTVTLGDEGRELLESAAAFADLEYLDDLGWLEQVSMETGVSVKDQIISGNLALKLGEDELLTANSIADMERETAYLQVPVLSDKYIGAELDEYLDELSYYFEDGDIIAHFETLYECYPDKGAVERLLYKYCMLAVSCIDDVEKSRETLHAGDVSLKCTALRTVIRSGTLQNMSKTVLTEMKNDEELRQIMKEFSKLEGFGYVYDDYRDLLDEALDEAEDIDLYDDIVLTVYVNNKGEIIGAQVKTGDNRLYCASLQKGKDIGCEVICDVYGGGFQLEGKGKESGNRVSADFVLETDSYYGSEEVEFRVEDFDKKAAAQGDLSGTVILPLEETEDLFGIDGRILQRYVLVMTFDVKESARKADLRLMNDEEEVVCVSWDMKTGGGKEVSVPENSDVIMIEDEGGLADWINSVDTERFTNHLKETGLPKDIIYDIENLLDWYM